MRIDIVVGTRPNFVKVAPIIRAIEEYKDIEYRLIHTGQHYDCFIDDVFFKELDLPQPYINLNVGSVSHPIAEMMCKLEDFWNIDRPEVVLVVGDVNSTVAAALVVSKLDIKLIHVEAGERSFDRTMPEEINRIITDHISDLLFCSTSTAIDNLNNDGIPVEKRYIVGNVMVDSVLHYLSKASKISVPLEDYVFLTLHRAANVDSYDKLKAILEAINSISYEMKVIFSIHPRTKTQIDKFGLWKYLSNVEIKFPPLSYLNCIAYMKGAKIIMTDSGGIQFEAATLKVPCITIRDSTEHTETIINKVNILVKTEKEKIITTFRSVLKSEYIPMNTGDGKASKRIIDILKRESKKW